MISIATGTLGTIAGCGEAGYAGDRGPAHLAHLNEPKNIALDRQGNLYIADSENHVIRKVDCRSGVITTVAGMIVTGGAEDPFTPALQAADGGPDSDDPLADGSGGSSPAYSSTSDISGMVRYVIGQTRGSKRFAGDGSRADRALLNFPSAVAVDSRGVLYIADTWNHRIRRVDPETGLIDTIAGTGQARYAGDNGPATAAALNEPVALALDRDRLLFVADQSNNRVRQVDLETGIITTVAGNGEPGYTGDRTAAVASGLSGPSGLALDAVGNLYIADTFSGRIRKVDRQTGIIDTVLGDGSEFRFESGVNESSKSLSRPYGIAVDAQGSLVITDSDNHLLRKLDCTTGMVSLVAGTGEARFDGDGQAPECSSLNFPFGVAVDVRGGIYIADTFNHRIRMIAV